MSSSILSGQQPASHSQSAMHPMQVVPMLSWPYKKARQSIRTCHSITVILNTLFGQSLHSTECCVAQH